MVLLGDLSDGDEQLILRLIRVTLCTIQGWDIANVYGLRIHPVQHGPEKSRRTPRLIDGKDWVLDDLLKC